MIPYAMLPNDGDVKEQKQKGGLDVDDGPAGNAEAWPVHSDATTIPLSLFLVFLQVCTYISTYQADKPRRMGYWQATLAKVGLAQPAGPKITAHDRAVLESVPCAHLIHVDGAD